MFGDPKREFVQHFIFGKMPSGGSSPLSPAAQSVSAVYLPCGNPRIDTQRFGRPRLRGLYLAFLKRGPEDLAHSQNERAPIFSAAPAAAEKQLRWCARLGGTRLGPRVKSQVRDA